MNSHIVAQAANPISRENFADENFILKTLGPDILSMANAGPHWNGSQFVICVVKMDRLDGKRGLFGKERDSTDIVKATVFCVQEWQDQQDSRPFR